MILFWHVFGIFYCDFPCHVCCIWRSVFNWIESSVLISGALDLVLILFSFLREFRCAHCVIKQKLPGWHVCGCCLLKEAWSMPIYWVFCKKWKIPFYLLLLVFGEGGGYQVVEMPSLRVLLCLSLFYICIHSAFIRSMDEIYNLLAERLVPVAAAESHLNFKWVPQS